LLQVDVNEGADLPLILPREQKPWTAQFATLFRRSAKEQWRRRAMLITQLIQTIMMAAMVGYILIQDPSASKPEDVALCRMRFASLFQQQRRDACC
jgi:hypothetical protein